METLAGIWIWPEAPVNDESRHKPIQLGHKKDLPPDKIGMRNQA